MTVRPPLSSQSEVVNTNRRWNQDWYTWLSDLVTGVNSISTGGGGGSLPSLYIDVNAEPYLSMVVPNGIGFGGLDDWTPALNAATQFILDNGEIGTILLPPFTINTIDTWKIGDTAGTGTGTGTAVTINIEGCGISSIVFWGGFHTPAIWVAKNKRFTFRNFSLIQGDDSGAANTGLVLGGSVNAVGTTECTGGVLEMVQVSGLQKQVSDLNGAASELTFIDCWFSMSTSSFGRGLSTTGVRFDFTNSANHTYTNCQFGNLDIGLEVTQQSNVNVFGGGASQNGIDFKAGLRCRLLLDGTRNDQFGDRTDGRFVVGSSGSVSIRCARVNVNNGGDNHAITGTFLNFIMESSTINGHIHFDDIANAKDITMIGNAIWPRGANGVPFSVASGAGNEGDFYVICKGNQDTAGDVYDLSFNPVPVLDFEGHYGTLGSGDLIFDPIVWATKPGTSHTFAAGFTDLIGVATQALHRVKCLSEARVPVASDPTTASTGANLRVQGKFATSNSLSLTFKRTVSVTTSSPDIVAGSAFFLSDVGKQVLITGGGNPSGDFNGCIDSLNTGGTHATLIAANGRHQPNYGGSKNVVIGADEPDANYMVLVTGNANETFWVDTITSSGFTVHSSNAASTATVTCLIVR